MPLIKSILKAGIDSLPDAPVKAESLPNVLKKQGIKEEELLYSGIELPKTGKVSKKELAQLEAGRKDTFGKTETQDYQIYSLKEGQQNPTYKENVYTFKSDEPKAWSTNKQGYVESASSFDEQVAAIQQAHANPGEELDYLEGVFDEAQIAEIVAELNAGASSRAVEVLHATKTATPSRYTSEHFAEVPNYLMHTRTYDDTINGQPTRVVQEIQSDLHQAGRRVGYAPNLVDKADRVAIQVKLAAFDNAITKQTELELTDIVAKYGYNPAQDELDIFARAILDGSAGKAPSSPYKASWLKKGIEREIATAIEEGKTQIAIPISGAVNDLQRGEGVQKWYETKVLSTVKKLAKANNMTFEEVTKKEPSSFRALKESEAEILRAHYVEDDDGYMDAAIDVLAEYGAEDFADPESFTHSLLKNNGAELGGGDVTYAVLKHKGGQKPSFSLYSSPAAGAMAAYTAISAGYTEEEVSAKLQEQGYDEAEAVQVIAESNKVAAAVQAGYTVEEAQQYLTGKEPKIGTRESEASSPIAEPSEETTWGATYRALVSEEEIAPKDLVAKLEVLAPNASFMTTNLAGFFGDEEARRTVEAAAQASQQRIIVLAAKRGLNLEVKNGEYLAQTEQGLVPVTPAWWQAFWEAKGELTGAIAGGIAGLKFGAAVMPPVLPIIGPLSKPAGALFGSIIGAATGAMAGTEVDYLHNAITLQENINAEIMARKALTAAEASIVGDVLFLGAGKIIGKSWRSVVQAKEMIKDGMFDRARVALKEQLFITDDEAAELVTKLSKVATVPGKGKAEQEIAAAMTTQPGGEGIVKASTAIDAKASAAIANAIDSRAKDLLNATSDLTSENVGRVLQGELEAYTSAVKENFGRVKAVPAQSPRANNFRFNYDVIAIDPVLAKLSKNIDNPDVAYKFGKQAQRIRDMSTTRSLADLLDLRQLVNDFKFNKRIRSVKDFDMLNEVLGRVDGAIQQGAHHTLDNPKQWLKEYSEARLSYAKMKQLEKNQLTKIFNRPGVSEKVIGQALAKYAYAIDDTFVEVLAQMPKATRAKVEGTVLDVLANKYTAGLEGGQRAVNFPALATDLQGVTFTSPNARKMKLAVTELAEVFRNDVPLAQASGNIQIPKFQSFLTADPVVRAKFEIASSVFNGIKSFAPGSKARALQLVRKTAKVLENPVNSKSIKELIKELDGAVDITKELEALAVDTAKRKAATGSSGMLRVRLHGSGSVLTAKGTGPAKLIPVHRIATTDVMKTVAEATGINQADRKLLDQALRDRGYIAAQLGADSVRLIERK